MQRYDIGKTAVYRSLVAHAAMAVEEGVCLPPSLLALAGVGSRGSRWRGPEDRHAAHRYEQG